MAKKVKFNSDRSGTGSGPRSGARKPTDSELAILDVIWDRGSGTVREVFEELSTRSDIGYTTVLKLMQIMVEKGLLTRDTSVRPQVFQAGVPQKQTQKAMVGHLLDGAFRGSPGSLVLQALSMRKSSTEELAQIRKMLDELDGGGA
jgi:BlaI family transcriptional regulator, penicillinase repressor